MEVSLVVTGDNNIWAPSVVFFTLYFFFVCVLWEGFIGGVEA